MMGLSEIWWAWTESNRYNQPIMSRTLLTNKLQAHNLILVE